MDRLLSLWVALPVLAASVVAAGVLWTKLLKPLVQGVATLIDYAEFLHHEVSGGDGSMRSELKTVHAQLTSVVANVDRNSAQLGELVVQVENMDTVWSKWVFSHAHEHAEIWRILALLGYDRRHYTDPHDPQQGGKER